MSKKQKGLNPELEAAINKLLVQVISDPTASLTDKMKVVDRSIKLEALKIKMTDDDWGSGFLQSDDDE